MLFVLPMEGMASGPSETDSSTVLNALPQLSRTKVALGIPKFKFERQYDLIEAAKSLGITAPFSPGTLCLLENDNCDLFIAKFIQKIVIDLHENGVEAAAVTLVAVGRSAPTPVEELP